MSHDEHTIIYVRDTTGPVEFGGPLGIHAVGGEIKDFDPALFSKEPSRGWTLTMRRGWRTLWRRKWTFEQEDGDG